MPIKNFSEIASLFPEPSMLVTEEGIILAANAAASNLFKTPSESLEGSSLANFLQEPHEKISHYLKSCAGGTQFKTETFCVKAEKKDSVYTAECALTEQGDNSSAILLLRFKDKAPVKGKAAAKQKVNNPGRETQSHYISGEDLRSSEKKFSAIFNQVGIGIIQADLEGNIILVNEKFARFVNRSIEELKKLQIKDITYPPDLPVTSSVLSQVISGDENLMLEKRYILPDNSIVWSSNSVVLMRDANGRPQYLLAIVNDITAQKKMQEELRMNDERLQAIINQASVGIAQMDLNGRIFFANERYGEIVGRDSRGLVSKSVYDITHPDDLKRNKELYRKTVKEGTGFIMEKRYVKPDGSIVWVNKSVSLVKDSEGKPLFVVAVVQDITDRKHVQEALRLNEERLQAIINQASVGIAQMDLNGRIFFANERYGEIVGRDSRGLVSKSVYDITHPDDLKRNKELYRKTVKEGTGFIMEKRYVKPDGSIVWVNKSVSLVKDSEGKPLFVVAVVQDITDRKHVQEELRLNEERLQAIINQASVGIAQMDFNGKIFFANNRYSDIVGRGTEELIDLSVYSITHPDDLEKNRMLYANTVNKGESFILEKRYIKPDGEIVWVNKSVSLVKDENSKPLFVVAVVQDVTARKLAEEALLTAHEKLEHKVIERTAELAEANESLMAEIIERKRTEQKLRATQKELIHAEKLSALGRVATNIAHEIRNPLANISASSQYIIKKFGKQPDINSLLEIIIRNTDTANDKIKELLDFASPRDLELKAGNLEQLLSNVCSLVSTRCLQNNVKCSLNIPSEVPAVKFNKKKLEEALLNLLTNSLDAMPGGGELDIVVSGSAHPGYLSIIIKDSGCGIASENIDKVFEPFFTTKHTGVGLGLSLVHQIIQLHNGKLTIESTEGEGTSITIQLPVENS